MQSSKALRKAVIPAAGRGTRFLPATKETPKEMLPLLDRPMIHYVVDELVGSGIKDIILVVTPGKESIQRYFSTNTALEKFLADKGKQQLLRTVQEISSMVNIEVVIQEEPLGLGHAVLCAAQAVGEDDFAVILPDDLIFSKKPCIAQLEEQRNKNAGDAIIGVMEVPIEETSKYGVIQGEGLGQDLEKLFKIQKMVEKPTPEAAPSNLATPGRYIFSQDIFKYLRAIEKGAGGEYQLTDAINLMAQDKKVLAYIYEGERYDIGQLSGYLQASFYQAFQRPELRQSLIGFLDKQGFEFKGEKCPS